LDSLKKQQLKIDLLENTFVSADQEQNQAAANEGLFIENPNHYI